MWLQFVALIVLSLLCSAYIEDFNNQNIVVPRLNKCFNMTYTSTQRSEMWRCASMDGSDAQAVWRFQYTGTENCDAVYPESSVNVNRYGGCSGNTLYYVTNCTEAINAIGDDTDDEDDCGWVQFADMSPTPSARQNYPLNQCRITGEASSEMYVCENGVVYREYWFNNANCEGDAESSRDNIDSDYDFVRKNCGSKVCSPVVYSYEIGSSDYCPRASKKHPYRPRGNQNCNYMQQYDGGHAVALGYCATNRVGFYEYAYRYECVKSVTNPGEYWVELVYYLGTSTCASSSHEDRYVVAEYSSVNITIVCDQSNCNHGIRQYDDCTFKNEFTTTPLVWNLCQSLYQDPDNYHDYGYDVNNASWAQHMSYKWGCVDYEATEDQTFRLPVQFGFLDTDCSTSQQYVGYPSYSGIYYPYLDYNDDTLKYCARSEFIGC